MDLRSLEGKPYMWVYYAHQIASSNIGNKRKDKITGNLYVTFSFVFEANTALILYFDGLTVVKKESVRENKDCLFKNRKLFRQ